MHMPYTFHVSVNIGEEKANGSRFTNFLPTKIFLCTVNSSTCSQDTIWSYICMQTIFVINASPRHTTLGVC